MLTPWFLAECSAGDSLAIRCSRCTGSFLGVELTIVAILVLAFEVVDAIGNIAGLLNLDNETACSDGVDSAGWDKETVVLPSRYTEPGHR